MYEKHFGFSDLPFTVTPDPRFFYNNTVYREAFATLRYGIQARKGFIVITGEVGTGKTTLLKLFMQNAEATVHTALIFNPKLSFLEILRAVLSDLGIAQDGSDDRLSLLEKLNDFLIAQIRKRQIVALLVDEAQDLSEELLEELRLLSNLETDKDKLLQMVLIGQPELENKLDQPSLRQFKQRVALRCRLAPLSPDEVRQYIDFRLKTAGYEGKGLFGPAALERITFHSKGTPRLINMICDNALLIAYAASRQSVTPEIVEEVARDLQLVAPVKQPPAQPEPHAPEPLQEPTSAEETPPMAPGVAQPLAAPAYSFDAEAAPDRLPARSRAPGLVIGLVLGFILAAGVGALLYPQGNYLAQVTSWIEARAAGTRDDPMQANSSTASAPAAAVAPSKPPVPQKPAEPPNPSANPEIKTDPTAKNAKVLSSVKMPAAFKNPPAVETNSTVNLPTVEPQLASRKPDGATAGREKSVTVGNFEVVENSFLRARPDSQADIVSTLEPGTWVRVEGRAGDYLRVRSLHDARLRGYVHAEDAFFERIAKRRDKETRR